ncbi:MAG: hypothetical protein JO037_10490, partial [Actinobacteria bacterium]|nr:hypothetical protein [Actinomycetota bacterium]
MSVGARAGTSGAAMPGAAEGTRLATADTVGCLLGRLSVLPALVVMAWLLAGLPLLLAHRFTPRLMLAVWVPLAVVLVVLGLRWIPGLGRIPGRWPAALPDGTHGPERTPWWTMAGVIAVAVAFGVDQMIYRSQMILVMRDPASYL